MKLFRGIRRHRFPLIGWGKTYLHWVSVIDLAKAFRLALTADVPSGEVFLIAGRAPILLEDCVRKIAGAVGAKPPRFRVPALPVQLLGDICEMVCVPLGIEPPIYRRRVDVFTKTRAFSWEKARKVLGYEPRGTIDDEIREIVSWYEQHQWQLPT